MIGGVNTASRRRCPFNICRKVYLVHRRDTLRAEKIMQDKLQAKIQSGRIEPVWHHTVDEVLGNDAGVTGLRVRSTQDDSTRELAIHGLFVAIGHTPNTSLFEGQLAMNNGYIEIRSGLAGNATATSITGVFAAGDVADQLYRQAVTSAGFGCMAALDAEKFGQGCLKAQAWHRALSECTSSRTGERQTICRRKNLRTSPMSRQPVMPS